ncbi:MAG: hypothetical protein J6S96_01245 [Muribaculaceae bacterium]|nr:hypothetical protein [Muribaculaceae bacterium]
MANKRQLKKAICHACGQIAGECLMTQAALDYKDAEKWDEIVIDAALLQVAALKKVQPKFEPKPKSFANGKEYKRARREFYKNNEKELASFMKEEIGKIVGKMNALLPKK